MPSDIVCIDIDTNGNFYLGYQIWWINPDKYGLIRNASHMKIISGFQPEPNTQPFVGLLKGVAITAAFNWRQSEKEFVYLFAGRYLCRQEISFEWVPMCNITDINDLVIGCSHENDSKTSVRPQNHTQNTTDVLIYSYTSTQIPYETNYTLIVLIFSIVILILLILALVLVGVYIRRNKDKQKDKQKEEPTLRFIDNKSTKHLHSDIPSPKPKTDESDDSFDVKTISSNTSNKKINTKKSVTTSSDM